MTTTFAGIPRPAHELAFLQRYANSWHNPVLCAGTICVIHNPSNHNMRGWLMTMRESTLVERMCPHNIGHPDPDSAQALNLLHYGTKTPEFGFHIHGCDGCCTRHPTTIRSAW